MVVRNLQLHLIQRFTPLDEELPFVIEVNVDNKYRHNQGLMHLLWYEEQSESWIATMKSGQNLLQSDVKKNQVYPVLPQYLLFYNNIYTIHVCITQSVCV